MQEHSVLLGVQAAVGTAASISANVPTKQRLANNKAGQTLKLKLQPFSP